MFDFDLTFFFFFFNDTATTEIYTLSLHDALPIFPGEEFPVILPRSSEGLYLLQRVRDEAHRFAIAFHRERRSQRQTAPPPHPIPRPRPPPPQAPPPHLRSG